MYKIKILNHIAKKGLDYLTSAGYDLEADLNVCDAIILRSHSLHDAKIPPSLKAVARAGAGVNNIPVDKLTRLGVPVFNTPGANANAVKELVILGMLLACRNIPKALQYVEALQGNDTDINQQVEADKKQFSGFELPGKRLAVIGLGAIGVKVANAALSLEMDVIGYDPVITIQRAWQLSSQVTHAQSIAEAVSHADFISLHIPYNEKTKDLINGAILAKMKKSAVLLNFSREGVIEKQALSESLQQDKLHAYVCDFPSSQWMNHPKTICLPHLGASTKEANENCAVMAAKNLFEYLDNGQINCAVNFPDTVMPTTTNHRLCITNENVPNMVGQISTTLAQADINIIDMINKSKDNIAYTLLDLNRAIPAAIVKQVADIEGILKLRLIEPH